MPVWAITKLTQIFSFKWILWYANSCHGEPLSMLLDPTAIQEGSAWGIWKSSRGQSLIEKSNSYDDLMTDSQYYVYSTSVFLSMNSNGFFFFLLRVSIFQKKVWLHPSPKTLSYREPLFRLPNCLFLRWNFLTLGSLSNPLAPLTEYKDFMSTASDYNLVTSISYRNQWGVSVKHINFIRLTCHKV